MIRALFVGKLLKPLVYQPRNVKSFPKVDRCTITIEMLQVGLAGMEHIYSTDKSSRTD